MKYSSALIRNNMRLVSVGKLKVHNRECIFFNTNQLVYQWKFIQHFHVSQECYWCISYSCERHKPRIIMFLFPSLWHQNRSYWNMRSISYFDDIGTTSKILYRTMFCPSSTLAYETEYSIKTQSSNSDKSKSVQSPSFCSVFLGIQLVYKKSKVLVSNDTYIIVTPTHFSFVAEHERLLVFDSLPPRIV